MHLREQHPGTHLLQFGAHGLPVVRRSVARVEQLGVARGVHPVLGQLPGAVVGAGGEVAVPALGLAVFWRLGHGRLLGVGRLARGIAAAILP